MSLIQSFMAEVDAKIPDKIVNHKSVDTEDQIKRAAKGISWKLAASEAIWGLISEGLLIPGSPNPLPKIESLGYTTVVPGSGGESSGLDLSDLSIPVPANVILPFSVASTSQQPLSDPDLFLHHLDIPGLHAEVEQSLREAVRCFRHELYLACLAMLGKASEGAWLELGLKLITAIPPRSSIKLETIKEKLESPYWGISKKIDEVLKLYENKNLFESVYNASQVKVQDLKNIVIWADCVRESRNSVHYGVQPSMPNTYEKVAALLIGAVPHLRLLYRIMGAINTIEKNI